MTRNHLLDLLDDPSNPWSEHSFELDDTNFGLGFKLTIITDPNDGTPLTKQYSWNGAAGTEFWIDPVESLINITLIQKWIATGCYVKIWRSLFIKRLCQILISKH